MVFKVIVPRPRSYLSDGCRSVCSKTWPLLLILPLAPCLCFLFSVLHLPWEDRSRVCARAPMLSNFLHVILSFEFPFLEVGGLEFQDRLVLQGLMPNLNGLIDPFITGEVCSVCVSRAPHRLDQTLPHLALFGQILFYTIYCNYNLYLCRVAALGLFAGVVLVLLLFCLYRVLCPRNYGQNGVPHGRRRRGDLPCDEYGYSPPISEISPLLLRGHSMVRIKLTCTDEFP